MSIDGIFSEVGELGRQQFKYINLINILHIYFPFYMLQYTFVARNVDFYCNLNTSQILNGEPSSTLSTNDLLALGKWICDQRIPQQNQDTYLVKRL